MSAGTSGPQSGFVNVSAATDMQSAANAYGGYITAAPISAISGAVRGHNWFLYITIGAVIVGGLYFTGTLKKVLK